MRYPTGTVLRARYSGWTYTVLAEPDKQNPKHWQCREKFWDGRENPIIQWVIESDMNAMEVIEMKEVKDE